MRSRWSCLFRSRSSKGAGVLVMSGHPTLGGAQGEVFALVLARVPQDVQAALGAILANLPAGLGLPGGDRDGQVVADADLVGRHGCSSRVVERIPTPFCA